MMDSHLVVGGQGGEDHPEAEAEDHPQARHPPEEDHPQEEHPPAEDRQPEEDQQHEGPQLGQSEEGPPEDNLLQEDEGDKYHY